MIVLFIQTPSSSKDGECACERMAACNHFFLSARATGDSLTPETGEGRFVQPRDVITARDVGFPKWNESPRFPPSAR